MPDRIVVLPGAKIGFAEMKRPRRKNDNNSRQANRLSTKIGFFDTSVR